MAKRTIDQVDVRGRRVLVRVDFNVPQDDGGGITDDRRIQAALPTIHSVLKRGGRAVLMSHLGRPKGRGYEAQLSLQPVADRLAALLPGARVVIPDTDCISEKSKAAASTLKDGEVVLLENLRFHAGEEQNDSAFAMALASMGDVYCNDAFGAAHRSHASIVGVPRAMPGKPHVAGFLMRDELKFIHDALENPARPFVAVLGGAKVSDKLGVIRHLLNKVDAILVGGAMAYTFCKALGQEVGTSKVQLGMLAEARAILNEAAASRADLVLPTDHVCGKEITSHTPVQVFKGSIGEGWMGLDIGPETVAAFTKRIHGAKTIVWNGPLGVSEVSPFDVGTRIVAEAIAKATKGGAVSIVGGGDSAAAVEQLGLGGQFSHVSTGGGASLELLEGRSFESVAVLDEA